MQQNDFEIDAGGHGLQVRRIAPEEQRGEATLVFLHEGLGSIAQWKSFPEDLVRRCGLRALLYDRRGHGRSAPTNLPRALDYLDWEAQEALPQVLEACQVEKPLLIGHSDGGSIALLYAAAFPEMPLAAVTMAAHVFVESVTLDGIRQATELWHGTNLPERLARYHGGKTETLFRSWSDTWLSPAFAAWNIEARLPQITCPLLVVQGAEDQYGTERQVESIVGGSGGPAQPLILPNCGHAPHLEAAEATSGGIAAFIEAIETLV